jgi:hypothetical protein
VEVGGEGRKGGTCILPLREQAVIVLPSNSETYVARGRDRIVSQVEMLLGRIPTIIRAAKYGSEQGDRSTHIILKSDPSGIDDLVFPRVDMGDLVPDTCLLNQLASSFDL